MEFLDKPLSMWFVAIVIVFIIAGCIWAMVKRTKKFRPLYFILLVTWTIVGYQFFRLIFFNPDF